MGGVDKGIYHAGAGGSKKALRGVVAMWLLSEPIWAFKGEG